MNLKRMVIKVSKPNNKKNNTEKISVLVTLIFVIIISSMSVGFALYSKILNIGGDLTFKKIGKIELTRIDYISSSNVAEHSTPTFEGMAADFNVVFRKEEGSETDDFNIIYEVELTNGYYKEYVFRGFDFSPNITSSSSGDTAVLKLDVEGVENGDVLNPGETKTFRLILTLETNNVNGQYTTDVGTEVDATQETEDEGSIVATITPSTGDLRGSNELAEFKVEVINTFAYEREFRLLSSNSNFIITDSNGTTINSLSIDANSSDEYTIYIKKNTGAVFLENTATTTILLSSNGLANVTAGNLTLDVDVYNEPDTDKVRVSNATLSMYRVSGKAQAGAMVATWQRDDIGGTSVTDYVLLLYNSSGSLLRTDHTNSSVPSFTYNNIDDGTYYFVVYGIDAAGNTGADYASSATTSSGYATKSESVGMKWRYTVDSSNLSNLTFNGSSTVTLDSTYTATITASGWYSVPNSLTTVTMGGVALSTSNGGYTYTRSSDSTATITIPNVNGNIVIAGSASGGCLIEGTKVLLANGTYKNIEDIDYDDLLLVYNYETGEFTEEYPIWIEQEKKTMKYQENIFSDGTVLKTYGYHGVYETELNRFVSVDNPNEFHIGSKVAKLKKNKNSFDTVTVIDIRQRKEKVNYYHVVSTRYYNIIANDLLTTDGTVILSNLYGFTDKMTWNKDIRNKAMLDVYSYDDLKDAIPYYMYKGLRAEEGKFLASYGLDINIFKTYLIQNQNNPEMIKKPLQKFNKNIWMVTTSEDNITKINKHNYLKTEGSIYILPKSKNKKFTGWLNTSDNKIYQPGNKVKIYHGTYFKAIYK